MQTMGGVVLFVSSLVYIYTRNKEKKKKRKIVHLTILVAAPQT